VVEGARFEIVCTARYRGFKSLFLRHFSSMLVIIRAAACEVKSGTIGGRALHEVKGRRPERDLYFHCHKRVCRLAPFSVYGVSFWVEYRGFSISFSPYTHAH
jgi:hypothetical protein